MFWKICKRVYAHGLTGGLRVSQARGSMKVNFHKVAASQQEPSGQSVLHTLSIANKCKMPKCNPDLLPWPRYNNGNKISRLEYMILGCRVFWEKKEKVSEGPEIDYTSFPPTHKEAQNTSAKTPSAPVPPPFPSASSSNSYAMGNSSSSTLLNRMFEGLCLPIQLGSYPGMRR